MLQNFFNELEASGQTVESFFKEFCIISKYEEYDEDDYDDYEDEDSGFGDEEDKSSSDRDEEGAVSGPAKEQFLSIDIDLGLSPWANSGQYYDQKKSAAAKEEKTVR